MDFQQAASVLADIPHTRPHRGRVLYDFIRETRPERILELGFAHGVSTCYLAAALESNGTGSILTIDNQTAKARVPDITSLLERLELTRFVTPIFSASSYTWELMKLIEQQTRDSVCEPCFDFCFIDGAHLWSVDGFAFLLAEKLLKSGAWVLFDDLYWNFAEGMKGTELEGSVPAEEAATAQVERVFTLLACQHPGFEQATIRDGWGWVRKKDNVGASRDSAIDAVYAKQSIRSDLISIANKIRWRKRLHEVGSRPR